MADYYEIVIKGQLDGGWSAWFSGLLITPLDGDQTMISGQLEDQAMLHGLLERIRDLNLALISVRQGKIDELKNE